MTLGEPKAVIFDFDYTLADSSSGIVACVHYALGAMGLPRAPEADICRTIGLSLHEAFPLYVDERHAARADEFMALFVRRADQIMVAHTALLPGAAQSVRALNARGLRLGIVTTKFRYRIEAVLARDGLTDGFDTVIGYEDVAAPKPDPQGLRRALARLDVAPDAALYVGDSLVDARTAQSAGVPFAAVLTGTTVRAEFAPFEPVLILDTVAALPPLLTGETPGRTE